MVGVMGNSEMGNGEVDPPVKHGDGVRPPRPHHTPPMIMMLTIRAGLSIRRISIRRILRDTGSG